MSAAPAPAAPSAGFRKRPPRRADASGPAAPPPAAPPASGDGPPGRMERLRAELAIGALGAILLALLVRLHAIQVRQHEDWRERATRQRRRVEELPPPRGDVLVHEGERLVPLCASVHAVSVFVAPSLLTEPETAAEARARLGALEPAARRKKIRRMLPEKVARARLAEALGVPPEQRDALAERYPDPESIARAFAERLEPGDPAAGAVARWLVPDRDFAQAQLAAMLGLTAAQRATVADRFERGLGTWLARRIEPRIGARIGALGLRGVELRDEPRRTYPFGSLGAHVAGIVNVDGRGLAGIEAVHDEELRGLPGRRTVEADNAGRVIVTERAEEIPPTPGLAVVLTLDRAVQLALEEELDAAMEKWKAKAAWGVFVEVGTGRILAMASRPTFDPSDPGQGPADAKRNRVITDVYEPGSTVKPLHVVAALDAGVTHLGESIFCENGSWHVPGRRKPVTDVHGHGMLSVAEVLVKSSNIGSCKLCFRLGHDRVKSALLAFGLGRPLGLVLPGERDGGLQGLQRPSRVHMASIAQGYAMQATALQMAMAFETLANGGLRHRPLLIDEMRDHHGRAVRVFEPEVIARVASEAHAQALRDPLRRVVEEGTARRAKIDEYSVAAKTGTTKKLINGRYSETISLLSFAGFAPAESPRVAFCVVVDHPDPATGARYAGSVAGPIATSVIRRVLPGLGVEPRAKSD